MLRRQADTGPAVQRDVVLMPLNARISLKQLAERLENVAHLLEHTAPLRDLRFQDTGVAVLGSFGTPRSAVERAVGNDVTNPYPSARWLRASGYILIASETVST
jgi:hypothetical protein